MRPPLLFHAIRAQDLAQVLDRGLVPSADGQLRLLRNHRPAQKRQ